MPSPPMQVDFPVNIAKFLRSAPMDASGIRFNLFQANVQFPYFLKTSESPDVWREYKKTSMLEFCSLSLFK